VLLLSIPLLLLPIPLQLLPITEKSLILHFSLFTFHYPTLFTVPHFSLFTTCARFIGIHFSLLPFPPHSSLLLGMLTIIY